ncbi:MAG: FAD-dependent oxidoreductase [Archangiaceae bacterium]|nr:FAD-dependent oxidoreductase [Archangiaceae bacterium]
MCKAMLTLGIPNFAFSDLYTAAGLARLHQVFLDQLKHDDAGLSAEFEAYRNDPAALNAIKSSDLLVRVAEHVSRFVGRLFQIDAEKQALAKKLTAELELFEFKREFVTRRVFKKGALDRPTAADLPELDRRMQGVFALAFPNDGRDPERALAESVLTLMHLEKAYASPEGPKPEQRERWEKISTALKTVPAVYGSTLVGTELEGIRGLLALADRWTYARAKFTHGFHGFSTIHQPKPLDFAHLVELKAADPKIPEAWQGPDEHQRNRDGFKLTDRRGDPRFVMSQVEYCVICHEREKDTCSKGFKEKDPVAAGHTYKKNPLGIPLTGCPLEEHISEMHLLKSRGDSLGALAMVVLDNPMCPGTGHRICNDCMKACIYQKQEPVDIPQIETSVLTDVLNLPYGFEIYGLFTRWNPLNVRRPHAAPYNGKNVMVVGMGPAGYTLTHYLLNEGFAVAGIDGLKIEGFSDEMLGRNGKPMKPLRDWKELAVELDDRVPAGFGGVSEYGITVRWDKTFLTLIHLTLARRENLRVYSGVRFGGTLDADDAWKLGFDHIAIAAGAGKPTLVNMKNNLIRGIRAASDFLMALQLTGAFKRDSLANLQVQLPAVVIGGGLTGIDTATELMAYYPVQVEKVLQRHEALSALHGEAKLLGRMESDERAIYQTFVEHGRAIRDERKRAAVEGRSPDFIKLLRAWGGVSLCYRRSLHESPAYRLNHEEVAKALEEGIRFIEHVSPVEAVPDEFGAVKAIRLERMKHLDGKLRGSGEHYEIGAKTVCVAAGTRPNITYEREKPGTFALDEDGAYFKGYYAKESGDGFTLELAEEHQDIGRSAGFFTSYQKDGRFISFYGDNHPTYAGNVVKAMASAKDGFPEVARLFAREVAKNKPEEQRARDRKRDELFEKLDSALKAEVVAVNRLTPTIVEVVVKAPYAARSFHPGQFYRLQNYESHARNVDSMRLTMEGLALTGAWVDKEKGLMSTIVLEMGGSSRLCAALEPGEPVVLMGPTGTPTEIVEGETVALCGGGLGNAVLFSIGQALKAAGCKVLYFAGFRQAADSYKMDEVEAGADQVIWSVDKGPQIAPRRPQDRAFTGNVVQAMLAFGKGELGEQKVRLQDVDRIIAIGSDRMMRAVKDARHAALKELLKPSHCAIGSINSPMQCMMKEICAQCLQRHVDPKTGSESFIFSCFNQDQALDWVDFNHLSSRLKANSGGQGWPTWGGGGAPRPPRA